MTQLPLKRVKNQEPKGKRYKTALEVTAKTFGCRDTYMLTTINVSKSGLLLGSKKYLPFRLNTLLEMTIDTSGLNFDDPIQCTAKVVRFAEEDIAEQNEYPAIIGVTFTQDGGAQNYDKWINFIDAVA